MAASHSRTYRSLSPARAAISALVAAGIAAMTSNSPVRWPTLTIRTSAASFSMWPRRSANSAEPAASASAIPHLPPTTGPVVVLNARPASLASTPARYPRQVPGRGRAILGGMPQSDPVDGFRLTYDRAGRGPAVLLLHGWPGDRTDYRAVVPRLTGAAEVVVPDLRGFGESDRHPADPGRQYTAAAQARSIIALIEELGLSRPVLAGYDIGSRIAQAVARVRPGLVRALVVSPPLPGIGARILSPRAQQEFWYQPFHQLGLSTELIDGQPDLVRTYLRHFWSHWSGPDFTLDGGHLEHLVSMYGRPGAFAASVAWYRSGAGSVAI